MIGIQNRKICERLKKQNLRKMTSKNQSGWKIWSHYSKGEPETLEKLWTATGKYHEGYEPNVEIGLNKLKKRIAADQTNIVKINPTRIWLRIAASLVVLLAVSFIVQNLITNSKQQIVSSGNIAKEVLLKDGTTVWLNQNSELTFPSPFDEDIRTVKIKGEGFFKVAKDPEKPFIVETDFGKITVLGTSFNIRCLEEEEHEIVHVEHGKVVYTSNKGEKKYLEKADKGILKKESGVIEIENDERFNSFAWRTNKLSFFGNSLKEIFEKVNQNLKVEFKVENTKALDCKYTVDFELKEVKEVFDALMLASDNNLRFEQLSKKKYKVLGKGCQD